MQEYFAAFELDHRRFLRRAHPVLLPPLRDSLKHQDYLPLEELVHLDHQGFSATSRYGTDARDHWRQAWSLVAFLADT